MKVFPALLVAVWQYRQGLFAGFRHNPPLQTLMLGKIFQYTTSPSQSTLRNLNIRNEIKNAA